MAEGAIRLEVSITAAQEVVDGIRVLADAVDNAVKAARALADVLESGPHDEPEEEVTTP